jgi:hypothetical protein
MIATPTIANSPLRNLSGKGQDLPRRPQHRRRRIAVDAHDQHPRPRNRACVDGRRGAREKTMVWRKVGSVHVSGL